MADKSKIEWTDATWNPIIGCSVVSPGCANCYAMKMAARIEAMREGERERAWNNPGVADPGPSHYAGLTQPSNADPVWTGKVALASDDTLTVPLRWKRPRRVFVNSMGDLFHEGVPDAWIDRVFAVMALCPQHTFQVLTKRSARMRAYLSTGRAHPVGMEALGLTLDAHARDRKSEVGAGVILQGDIAHLRDWPLHNVHIGVSAEDQRRADERIPDLLATPAAVRFVSAEPLLGAIDFTSIDLGDPVRRFAESDDITDSVDAFRYYTAATRRRAGLDWVIVGGESGSRARPMLLAWERSIREQCAAAKVAYFRKQWGEWIDADEFRARGFWAELKSDPLNYEDAARLAKLIGASFEHQSDGSTMIRVGKSRAGRTLDGVEHNAFPEVKR